MRQPKYKINQRVWLIYDNKLLELSISGIFGRYFYGSQKIGYITYSFWQPSTIDFPNGIPELDESLLFEFKQDLINSL